MSSIDELTGAYRRDAGIVELVRETARAKRTQEPLVLAFVDVDGLKATNDTQGHAAGDRILCTVVDVIRAHLRSYDLVVRYGGDEFVCAFADMTIEEAGERFLLINGDLATDRGLRSAWAWPNSFRGTLWTTSSRGLTRLCEPTAGTARRRAGARRGASGQALVLSRCCKRS